MAEDKNKIVLKRVEDEIAKIVDKKSSIYFFVSDCKNTPNSQMLYIYQMALTMKELGYNVCMLYQINNEYSKHELKKLRSSGKMVDETRVFEGVDKWLGEKYSTLVHLNIASGVWRVSPSDVLFIPEVFSSLMKETYDKGLPCKRVVILQNFKYVTEFIPYGDQWMNYGITEAVVSNENQAKLIKSVFPYVNTTVINPYIQESMRKPVTAKKLIVNIAATTSSDIEHIIKTFYWKYPTMQFVTFRSLRNLPVDEYAKMLKEGCITIWHDPYTPWGRSALDAIKCGNIVIGKVPEVLPEWMVDENGNALDNAVWYNSIDDIADILATVIGSWMRDEIPEKLMDGISETAKKYTYGEWKENVEKYINGIMESRKTEFTAFKNKIEAEIKEDK
jgi:hypothetical protein